MGEAFLNGRESERRGAVPAPYAGLSQNLALLAVELDLLGRNPPKSAALLRKQVQALAVRVRELSSDAQHIKAGSQEGGAAVAATKGTQRATGELSPRRREVLLLLAGGHSMKEIARRLKITPRTVAFHKYSMMEELGIRTSAELIQYAVRQHIIAG